MQVRVIGCNHQTSPLAVRERLAFSPAQTRTALISLRVRFPSLEAVLLSTCNRVELYTAADQDAAPTAHELVEFLADFHRLDPAPLSEHLYDRHGREMVRHLFLVASSLDSMVLGEPQISSQVKRAYQLATQEQVTGPLTHAAFQAAARVARRVAAETTIHHRRVSIPSVAVADFARQIFERFDDKRTLVIGAGEMAEETLRELQEQGAGTVTIINRHPQRARELAARRNGRASEWERLGEELAAADLVISATGATEPIITPALFEGVAAARGARPLVLLDLAVPRDIAPAVGTRPGVYLFGIDDLRAACERNRQDRAKELPQALRIVDDETERFMSQLHHRATGPVIQRLRTLWEQPKQQELQRLLDRLPHLDERARREIAYAFDRVTNKLFHAPLESLRVASREGAPNTLLDAVVRLFRCKD